MSEGKVQINENIKVVPYYNDRGCGGHNNYGGFPFFPPFGGYGEERCLESLILADKIGDNGLHTLNAISSNGRHNDSQTFGLSGRVADGNYHVLNAICDQGRHNDGQFSQVTGRVTDTGYHILNDINSTGRHNDNQFALLAGKVCDAESDILNTVHTDSRFNSLEHGQIKSKIGNAESRIISEICDSNRDQTNAINNVGFQSLKNTYDSTNTVSDRMYNQTNGIKSDLQRYGLENLERTTKVGTDVLLSNERHFGDVRNQAGRIGSELRSAVDRTEHSVLLASKDNLLELCKSTGAIERQAAENKACMLLDAHKNKEELEKLISRTTAEIKEHSFREACEIKELTREKACDIKSKIDCKLNETNSLIHGLKEDRIRDKLCLVKDKLDREREENLFLRLSRDRFLNPGSVGSVPLSVVDSVRANHQ